jgi:hypothetical protein
MIMDQENFVADPSGKSSSQNKNDFKKIDSQANGSEKNLKQTKPIESEDISKEINDEYERNPQIALK